MKRILTLFIPFIFTLNGFSQTPNWQWAKGIGDSSIVISQSIAMDGHGGIYIIGYFTGTIDFDPDSGVFNLTAVGYADIFISKFDTSGNFVWAKQIGGLDNDY